MYQPLLVNMNKLSSDIIKKTMKIGSNQSKLTEQMNKCIKNDSETYEQIASKALNKTKEYKAFFHNIENLAFILNKGELNKGELSKVSCQTLYDYIILNMLSTLHSLEKLNDQTFYPICLASELSDPKSYITTELHGESLLVVKDETNIIRVFYNICPHRYNRLLSGNGIIPKSGITCNYHGWQFDLSGDCQHIPLLSKGAFSGDFCKSSRKLQTLNHFVYKDIIYVCFDPTKKIEKYKVEQNYIAIQIARKREMIFSKKINLWKPSIPDDIRLLLRFGSVERELAVTGKVLDCINTHLIHQLIEGKKDYPSEFNVLLVEYRQLHIIISNYRAAWNISESLQRVISHFNATEKINNQSTLKTADFIIKDLQEVNEPQEALPIWVYDDSELYGLEIESIIKPIWQFVCHECEIPLPGDSCPLHIIGECLIVTRLQDGSLSAGRCLDIKNITESTIESIEINNWYGFLFVRLYASNAPSMDQYWESKDGLFEPYFKNLSPMKGSSWYDIPIEANYKLVWENYLEVYHFPYIHEGRSRICRPKLNSPFWPLREKLSKKTTELDREYHRCIFEGASHSLAEEKQLIAQAEKTRYLEKKLNYILFGAAANQNIGPILFGFTFFPEHVHVNSIIPVSTKECYFRMRCYSFPVDEQTQKGQALVRAREINTGNLLQDVTEEDIALNLQCQSVASTQGFNHTGVLANEEDAIVNFQNYLRRMVPIVRSRKRPQKGMVSKANFYLNN